MNNNSFEEETWKIVKELKGSIDTSKYKQIVLGLIFLKYITTKFEERRQELVEEGNNQENNPTLYINKKIFYIPEEARWNKISSQIRNDTYFLETINYAIDVIEQENKELIGVIPKFPIENMTRGNISIFISLITRINDTEKDSEVIKNLFKYCLNKFSELEGKKVEEAITPESIVKTVVEILGPTYGKLYDPCCGSAEFLIESSKFDEKNKGDKKSLSMYGQECNPNNWRIAKMNLAINQINANIGEPSHETLLDDLHSNIKADYIMANPPFNQKWSPDQVKGDKRWKYGLAPKGNANYAWIQHMLSHLSKDGKMAIVLPNGSLSSGSVESKIREAILNENIVEAIISLPSHLFYTTAIPVNIWIINKNKQQKGTLFIEARELGIMENRFHRKLENKDIQLLKDTYNKYIEGILEDKKGFCKVATLEDIENQEFVLTPGRYVGFKPGEEYSTRKLEEVYKDSLEKQVEIDKLNKKIEELIENL